MKEKLPPQNNRVKKVQRTPPLNRNRRDLTALSIFKTTSPGADTPNVRHQLALSVRALKETKRIQKLPPDSGYFFLNYKVNLPHSRCYILLSNRFMFTKKKWEHLKPFPGDSQSRRASL